MKSILIVRTKEAKEFPLPTPKKEGDVGFDLYTVEDTIIPCSKDGILGIGIDLFNDASLPTDVPTGVSIKLPPHTWGLVINRSSSPRKLGLEVVPGVIDNGYTGELFACCFNRTGKDIKVEKGTRIAQFIVLPALVPPLEEVNELPQTERGSTGFGSTN